MMDTNHSQKQIVHISRHWDNPTIAVRVNDRGIEIAISLENFCKAIVAEIKHPILIQTRSKMESQVLGVLESVLEKVKESSNYI